MFASVQGGEGSTYDIKVLFESRELMATPVNSAEASTQLTFAEAAAAAAAATAKAAATEATSANHEGCRKASDLQANHNHIPSGTIIIPTTAAAAVAATATVTTAATASAVATVSHIDCFCYLLPRAKNTK